MEKEIQEKFEEQNRKLNAIYESVEKTRKYFQLTFWITIALVVLPVIGLIFVIPLFMNTYVGMMSGF